MNEEKMRLEMPQAGIDIPTLSTHIVITPAENGIIVNAGCKTFVFLCWEATSEAIGLYLKSPAEAQKKYCK
jgi:hypothetical protein